jgi:hypothetical protein
MRTDERDLKVSMNRIKSYLTQTTLKGKVIEAGYLNMMHATYLRTIIKVYVAHAVTFYNIGKYNMILHYKALKHELKKL